MSSVVAVMQEGRIVQMGSPLEVYQRPTCRFVAEFIGTSTFVEGIVTAARRGKTTAVATPEGVLYVDSDVAAEPLPNGTKVVVSIRPEVIELTREGSDGARQNEWCGTVVSMAYLGATTDYIIEVGDRPVRVQGTASTAFAPGTRVYLYMDAGLLTLVPLAA
jgi:iron(III) transport system ATP-binding protein